METSNLTKVAAKAIVTLGTGWGLKELFGTKAGVLGAMAMLAAHEAFDAKVAGYLDRAVKSA